MNQEECSQIVLASTQAGKYVVFERGTESQSEAKIIENWNHLQLEFKRIHGTSDRKVLNLNPFTPKSDQLQFSLSVSHQRYIIQYGELGNRQFAQMKVNWTVISHYNTQSFSSWMVGGLCIMSLGLKGLTEIGKVLFPQRNPRRGEFHWELPDI